MLVVGVCERYRHGSLIVTPEEAHLQVTDISLPWAPQGESGVMDAAVIVRIGLLVGYVV